MDDARTDPQMVASGALAADRRPAGGRLADGREPVLAGGRAEKVAPRLGARAGRAPVEILRELGYGQPEIDKLLAARVVVQGKPAA